MHCRKALFFLLVLASLVKVCPANPQSSAPLLELRTIRPVDRVITRVDELQTIVLAGNQHPVVSLGNDIGAASPDRRMEKMILLLRPDQTQQSTLNVLVEAQQNPASPYYHQWLTPETYSSYFGVSEYHRNLVLDWLVSHGMQVDEASPGGMTILFSGTVAQVEETFHTQIHAYLWNHELHYANTGDPEIPAALSSVVDGVVSLNDFESKPPHTNASSLSPQVVNGQTYSLTPADHASIYNLTPLYSAGIDGAGVSIAVTGRTNIDLSDVRRFRSMFGLPANDLEIRVIGPDPGHLGLEEEAAALLNVEWAGAVARNASIKYVVSASTGTTDGIFLATQYIVENNLAPVISVGFVFCEAALGASANHFLNYLWQRAAVQGITVVVPSGNSRADGCDDESATSSSGRRAVNGLASTPYNTAVGGADSNGGASSIYDKPWWQHANGVPADAHRDIPDVTFAAENPDAYPIYMNGRVDIPEGSSLASASFAGIMALVVQHTGVSQGNSAPTLYSLANRQDLYGEASVFRHPRSTKDSGLDGDDLSPGYNFATGLGSVDANLLVTRWSDAADDNRNTHLSGFFSPRKSISAVTQPLMYAAPALDPSVSPTLTPASVPAPVLFYSDIDSGPATGGEAESDGAFVCVYGENFGPARNDSTISIGGTAAAAYKVWLDPGAPYLPGHYAKACAQISHATPSGSQTMQLNISQKTSNTLPFTVRPGNVYFASPAGNDNNAGTSSAPFATLKKCKNVLNPGDICYVHSMTVTAPDTYASLWLGASGTEGSPKAVVAYPGEAVTLDSTVNHIAKAMVNYATSKAKYVSYWTIAGLTFVAYNIGVDFESGTGFRFVDNEVTAPGSNTAGSETAGLIGGGVSTHALDKIAVYGNRVHNVGCGDPSDSAHYFNYASSTHPCGWTPAGKVSTVGRTVTQTTFSSGTELPNVIMAYNPGAAGQAQLRRLSTSATTPCAETTRGGFPCSSWNGTTQTFTIDQPFVPDLPAGTQLYYRLYAPAKTEHNVYFSAYTYHLDFGWNEIDGSEGRACRGFQIFHDAIPNNHNLLIHDNYIHDTVCDGINMNAFDATCGPVQIYNNLLVNTGEGVSDIIADLPGGGANYSSIYMSGSGTILPWLVEKSAIKTVGQAGSTQYSYGLISVFNGSYIIGPVSTIRTGNSTLNAINYNTFVLPALPADASSWSVIRTAGGGSVGMIASGLAGGSTFNDTGLTGDRKSYAQAGKCLAPTGQPLYPDQLLIYNNTIVNGGDVTNAAGMQWPGSNEEIGRSYDFHDPTTKLVLSNNIIVQPANSTVPYWMAYQASTANIVGTNNLCHGIGVCPLPFTASAIGNPKFVNQAVRDFHIQTDSAAVTKRRVTPSSLLDLDGLVRDSLYVVGAYALDPEFFKERPR